MKKRIYKIVTKSFEDSIAVKLAILNSKLIDQIVETSLVVASCLQNGGKLLFAGNGGSFADAQHLAAEFVSSFLLDRSALPALALGTNSSNITAIANDYGYQNVFSRELSALGSENDIFIPISTSGNSKNLIEAVNIANQKKLKSIAFTGKNGGALDKLCDCIKVPSTHVPRIQECHILIGHILCQLAEESIFKTKN